MPSASPSRAIARLKSRDVAVKAVTKCGRFRISVVSTRDVVRETLRRHRLVERTHGHEDFLRLLGTTVSFTNLMASFLQNEERFKCDFVAPEATVVCESLALGECRAYVSNSAEGAMHDTMKCERVLYNNSKPIVSVVNLSAFADDVCDGAYDGGASSAQIRNELLRYNLAPHAVNFFQRSEGVETAVGIACALSSTNDDDDVKAAEREGRSEAGRVDSISAPSSAETMSCVYSAGVLVQPIAVSDAEVAAVVRPLQKLFDHFSAVTDGHLSSDFLGCQDLLTLATGDIDGSRAVANAARQLTQEMPHEAVGAYRARFGGADGAALPLLNLDPHSVERTPLDFFCRCSREDFVKTIRQLGPQGVHELLKSSSSAAGGTGEEVSVTCKYCAKRLVARREELIGG